MRKVLCFIFLISILAYGATAIADQFQVTKIGGNIRSGPGTDYPSIDITSGKLWKVLDNQDKWIKVDDQKYIHINLGDYIKEEIILTSTPKKKIENIKKEIQVPILDIKLLVVMCIGGSVLFILLIIFIIDNFRKRSILKKYKPITDIEKHINDLDTEEKEIKECLTNLESEYDKKKKLLLNEFTRGSLKYSKLKQEISKYEEDLEMMEVGFTIPQFEFEDSETYKKEIKVIKDKQKLLRKNKDACICTTEWQVSGSRQEGRKMTTRTINLAIRSFNSDCNEVIAGVRWNNFDIKQNKINQSFDYINKMNEPNHTYLTDDFLKLKIRELVLTHQYKEKNQQEKEEQKAINEQIREEQKAEAELKKAAEKAKKEEHQALNDAKFAKKAYDKALKDIEAKGDKEKELQAEQIKILKSNLDKAQQVAKEKTGHIVELETIAQQTKMGRVYILTNIGSLGPDMCKIGMTRRFNPNDRVKELSGAPVPFPFDCHAMIATQNAYELEHTLHQAFADRRVNLTNMRKEHFYVSLDEVEVWLNDNGYEEAEFTKTREAKEWRQTQAMIKAKEKPVEKEIEKETEDSLFGEESK